MAEVAAGFLGPALEVVRWVGAPILRQFNYLCCFTTNITNLKNEAQKLQDTERDLQGIVDAARNDGRLISSEVETWLRNSKEIKDEKDGIMKEVPNVFSYYWSYKGCTILLTSRSRDVLSGMNIQKIFEMELLSQI